MAIELRGSMLVYLALVVTSAFTPFYRCAVFVFLTANSLWCGDILGEVPFYTGVLLADMSLLLNDEPLVSPRWVGPRLQRVQKYWPFILALFGLFLASYPPVDPDLSGWSRFLTRVGHRILHSDCILHHIFILTSVGERRGEFRWAYTQLGAGILIFSIHFSPTLRRIFSFRYAVFFGSISFAVYLTHSFLMRSILTWVMFGLLPRSSEDVGWFAWVIVRSLAFASFFALLTAISTLWRNRIDRVALFVAQWSEEVLLGKRAVLDSIDGILHKIVQRFTTRQGNSYSGTETKDKYIQP